MGTESGGEIVTIEQLLQKYREQLIRWTLVVGTYPRDYEAFIALSIEGREIRNELHKLGWNREVKS